MNPQLLRLLPAPAVCRLSLAAFLNDVEHAVADGEGECSAARARAPLQRALGGLCVLARRESGVCVLDATDGEYFGVDVAAETRGQFDREVAAREPHAHPLPS